MADAVRSNLPPLALHVPEPKFRPGDANMRSVWLRSRNDRIANVEFICGGAGVWVRISPWRHHCFIIAVGIGIVYQTSNGRA